MYLSNIFRKVIVMRTYKIPTQKLSVAPGITVKFHGKVYVDFPKARIEVPTSVTGCKDHTYRITLDPAKGHWDGQDSHKWTLANYEVVVRLSIDPIRPRFVNAEVFHPVKGKRHRLWHDEFDIYDPYKERKVEMFAQGAFIDPIKSNADHTYAVGYDDAGKRNYLWPCGGDHDENQRSIGHGMAFQPECDCLSQMRTDPLTKGLAGIRYGLDGVCHQATNRIMCTAGLEVNDAKGYKSKGWTNLTHTLYGRLGLLAIDGLGVKKWKSICDGCLTKRYPRCSEETEFLVSPNEHPGLMQSHVDLHQEMIVQLRHDLLDAYTKLAAGKLTPTEYADVLNASINGHKAQMQDFLGDTLHAEIFEDIATVDVVVVDPKIAEAVFANGVS